MKKFNEDHLEERFKAFLEKQGIDPKSMSEEALNIFEMGYRFAYATSPENKVKA